MTTKLNEAVADAIGAATASVRVLAEEAGLHISTLARWHIGARGASPSAALQLAGALRRRALGLLDLAARIEALAQTEEGDHG